MGKKKTNSLDDHKDWISYTKEMNDVYDKDLANSVGKKHRNKLRTIDLHGFSLEDANISIKKIINDSYEKNYNKIKVITGRGNRSKANVNPYISENLSILKNSVPEFIKKDNELLSKIKKIYPAKPEEGGDGAFFILLKNL